MTSKVRILRGDTWAVRLVEQLELSPADAAEWMEEHAQILKSDINSMSGLYRLDDTVCFLKLYRFKSPLHRILAGFGIGKPLRNFSAARDLGAEGLAIPRALACLLVSQGMLLLVEGLSAGGNLAELWQRQPAEEEARRMMRSAGDTLATLHRMGYAHRDCEWGNLFWDGHRMHLIDLDTARKCAPGASIQVEDLARFTVEAEGLSIGSGLYDLFLESYLQGMVETRHEVVQRMLPILYKYRTKHLRKYRSIGQRLV